MLIEVRIGIGKWKLKSIMAKLRREFKIYGNKIHKVPHLTLYGTFKCPKDKIKQVIECIESIGKRYSYLNFTIDGVDWVNGKKGKVIYFKIIPSEELKKFRLELAKELVKIVPHTKIWDKEFDREFLFHITLAYKLSDSEFNKIWSYMSDSTSILSKILSAFKPREIDKKLELKNFYLPTYGLRITLLSDKGRIICEYDLLQKRILSRKEALNLSEWKRTLKLFRIKAGMECAEAIKVRRRKTIFFIGDLHLDHANIIRYCSRPFSFYDVKEMNEVLIKNWNCTVNPDDKVYFLGDLAFGKKSKPAKFYLKHLNGDIILLKGSHDRGLEGTKEYEILQTGNHKFLILHNPDTKPIEWNDWVIHAHKHNNDIKAYPFINGKSKTINVSVELINYKPVSLDFLLSLDIDSIKRMDTINSKPIRW
jgi:calcineurin-like phosphoesterase family protein/2'-5' RNA ligase